MLGKCVLLVLEEEEEVIYFKDVKDVCYVVVCDLIDGFFNFDVGVFVGIIFVIYKLVEGLMGIKEDIFKFGMEFVVVGFIMYGVFV